MLEEGQQETVDVHSLPISKERLKFGRVKENASTAIFAYKS